MSASDDDGFNLGGPTRAQIEPHFDGDALERLLRRLPGHLRPRALRHFLRPEHRPPLPGVPSTNYLEFRRIGFTNPELDSLLQDIWQPYWDTQPRAALEDESSDIPGREPALKRRRGRD